MSELLRPEPWTERATCANFPGDAWFSDGGSGNINAIRAQNAEAVLVCRACPVQTECLDYALRTRQDWGIWGGVTADQRAKMRRVAS